MLCCAHAQALLPWWKFSLGNVGKGMGQGCRVPALAGEGVWLLDHFPQQHYGEGSLGNYLPVLFIWVRWPVRTPLELQIRCGLLHMCFHSYWWRMSHMASACWS